MGGGNPPASPGSDSSRDDELSKVANVVGPSWSYLPTDILLIILQYLEVPQIVVFASVCSTWRFAAAESGVPLCSVPWFMSWADLIHRKKNAQGGRSVACNLYHLLDVNKAYGVSFPRGCFVTCCGASHGWLVLVNELSNLVLYNPFTMSMVHLPPITDFACVEAVYNNGGTLAKYIYAGANAHETNSLGKWFYQKAVLSCSPSKGNGCIVMIIHSDSDWLSFVKEQVASSFNPI